MSSSLSPIGAKGPGVTSMSPLRFLPSGLLASAGGTLWLLVPESGSWIEGLILFGSAATLIFVSLVLAVYTMESELMPHILYDPFVSPMHRQARKSAHRRHGYPNGLASPSWYREAFAPRPVTEHSTIAE